MRPFSAPVTLFPPRPFCAPVSTNPFHYLTELQKHARELAAAPGQWMPWNYLHALASGQSLPAG